MPRPVKPRKIGFIPNHKRFIPEGKKLDSTDSILLLHDELEALRLKDIEDLNQTESAMMMNVSRQTFQLIIDSAHHKIATALVEGKPIVIEGGNYIVSDCTHRCPRCGNIHKTKFSLESNCNRKNRCCNNCQNE